MTVGLTVGRRVCEPIPGYQRTAGGMVQPPRPVPWKWIALGAVGIAGLVLAIRR
jgi:hypothetical protein